MVKNKIWSWIIKVLMPIAFLSIVVLYLCSCAEQQKIAGTEYLDDYKIKSSSVFFIRTEVRVDSLVIPANTVGKLRELNPNEKGGINMFIFDFNPKNGKEISLRFVRKELVEKSPTNNPRTFILRGEAESYEGKNCRYKKTLKLPSIPKGEECVLFFNQ